MAWIDEPSKKINHGKLKTHRKMGSRESNQVPGPSIGTLNVACIARYTARGSGPIYSLRGAAKDGPSSLNFDWGSDRLLISSD